MSRDAEKARTLEAQLISKAWEDETFKQALMTEPKAAIASAFGGTIPEDMEVEVLEETPNKLYLVLPVKPDTTNELSEEQLEAVAGGASGVPGMYPITYDYYGFNRLMYVGVLPLPLP